MANEFIIKNGYFSQGNSNITGSLTVTGGVTASLAGTASYALTASYIAGVATSASYSSTASYAIYAETASISNSTTLTQILVLNQTGFTINKGVVVRITGSNNASDIPRITTASYESDGVSANTLGIASQQITNGNTGYIVTEGVLTGITTSGWTSGTLLFLGATGSIISSAPQAPLHAVRLGQVIREQSSNGSIHVRVDNGYELRELHDVTDSTTIASYGDLLVKSGSVWKNSKQLSGSYGLTGSLGFYPSIDPGPTDTTSSFIFVSSSADNNEYNLHYRNNGIHWEQNWIEQTPESGLLFGGIVSYSGSTIYVSPGAGLLVDHNITTSSHGDTVPTYVPFGPITASATYITSSQLTYLLIDTDGTLLQQTSVFTPPQYIEKFPLGYITHLTTSSISSFADSRVTTSGQSEQLGQFTRAFGPLKINGYDLTAQSGSLKYSIASGRTFRYGGFYTANPDSPSIYDSTAVATGSIVRLYQDPTATGGFRAATNSGLPFTVIDPTKWDNGTGTLQTVDSSHWSIQRVFQGPINGLSYVYYGQNIYDSLNAAIQSITTEQFNESQATIISLPFIGYIICRGNTTDLNDTTNNKIINAGLFRNTAGSSGGGGVATTNLNDLADVTITSPANGQALIYNSGYWINGIADSSSYAYSSSISDLALNATSASFASTASYVVTAQTASYVTTAQTASYVLNAVSSSFATTASYATNALSASYAPSTSGPFGIANSSGVYTYYSTLSASIAAATSGQTVEMFTDYTEAGAVTVTLKNGITVNGNGHTYTLSTNNGQAFKIEDSISTVANIFNLTVVCSGTSATTLYLGTNTSGTLTLTGCIFKNTSTGTCISNYANSDIEIIDFKGFSNSGNCVSWSSSGGGKLRNSYAYSTSAYGYVGNVRVDNCICISGTNIGLYSNGNTISDTIGISAGSYGIQTAAGVLNNCKGYSSAASGIYALYSNLYTCFGYSTAGYGIQFDNEPCRGYNCLGFSTANNGIRIYRFGSGTADLAIYNSTAVSTSATAFVWEGYAAGMSCISEYNNAAGHAAIGAPNAIITNSNFSVTNASANCLNASSAVTQKYANCSFKGATTAVNANITQGMISTQDNFGNIII